MVRRDGPPSNGPARVTAPTGYALTMRGEERDLVVGRTMQAAHIRELGSPAAMIIGAVPTPAVGPTDVLVAVETVAVDPVDALIRSGAYQTAVPLPFVVGRDLTGRVVMVGSDVIGFEPGDRVWANSMGHDGRQGTFAEYAAVPADRCYHVPDGVDATIVVAVAHPAATAWLGLFRRAHVRAGETIVVGGAGGNVGAAVVEFAAGAGATVVGLARTDDAARCHALGALTVIDYRASDLASRIAAVARDGVDVFWDTSGHLDLPLLVSSLAVRGRVVVTAAMDGDTIVPSTDFYPRDASIVGFVLSRASAGELAAAATVINGCVAGGRLQPRITHRLGLGDTRRAHEMIESTGSDRVRGRIVIDVT